MSETMQTGKCVLAIDLGTGGPKVGLVDEAARVISSRSGAVQVIFLPDGGVEHDPDEWWSVITRCVREVLQESGLSPGDIAAVAVTSMWSVTTPVDEQARPLMNTMAWMDGRGAPYNRRIMAGFPEVQGYQLTRLLKYLDICGFPPTLKGADALGHILFIKNERPEIYRRTYKFLEPSDFINFRLTGRCAATQNTALPLLMVDNRRLDQTDYHPWLVKMGGVDREKLPDLIQLDSLHGTLLPSVAAEWGLAPNTPVVSAINDNSSSAIGAGAILPGETAAVLGTSGYLATHVPFKKTDIACSMATMPSGLKDSYLFWAELSNNGKVLESFLTNLVFPDDPLQDGRLREGANPPADMYLRASATAADVAPGSEGVIFLPWFNGAFSPGEDPLLRGGFLNISHRTTRAHLTRAVFEGLSMNWRWLRLPSEKLLGRKFTHWRLTGGGALSDVWCQIMADVVGLPMHRQADPRNSNVIGAAMLAFYRLGLAKLEDIPSKIKFDRIFEPNPKNKEIYDRIFTQFLASKDRIKPVFHALNKSH
jgi:xylulokinase